MSLMRTKKAFHDKKAKERNSVLIRDQKFENTEGNLYYLIDDDYCYGVIKVDKIEMIDRERFKELQPLHKLEDKDSYWDKNFLFAYHTEKVADFEPKKIKFRSKVCRE